MRVGVDLDGVVYPFVEVLRGYMIEREGYDPDRLVPVQTWHLYNDWGMTRDEFAKVYAASIEAGVMFGAGEPYEGSKEALQRIKDAGNSIHVVTAREGFGTPGMGEMTTRSWLDEHLPIVDSLTFSHDKTIVDVDVFIDDRLENYDAVHFAGKRAYLMNRPWNRQETEWPYRNRVNSMPEFADQVLRVFA